MEPEEKSPRLELKAIGGITHSGVADHYHNATRLAAQTVVINIGGTSSGN